MTLSRAFAAAGGVTGRAHRRAERDGQDGHAVVVTERVAAAIVTDGCSSGRASEIGARVGAAWIAALVAERFDDAGVDREAGARAAAEDVTARLVERLELLARSFDARGAVDPAYVAEALLFGFLAAVVTPSVAIVFGVGDGIVVVDGRVSVLDPGPKNAPPYAAYALLGAPIAPKVHFVGAAGSVEVLAVATDGLASLDGDGALVEIASDRRYAKNPSLLRKRLVVLSDAGTFSDDATIAVVQRRLA
jgi:hypothetical protein